MMGCNCKQGDEEFCACAAERAAADEPDTNADLWLVAGVIIASIVTCLVPYFPVVL